MHILKHAGHSTCSIKVVLLQYSSLLQSVWLPSPRPLAGPDALLKQGLVLVQHVSSAHPCASFSLSLINAVGVVYKTKVKVALFSPRPRCSSHGCCGVHLHCSAARVSRALLSLLPAQAGLHWSAQLRTGRFEKWWSRSPCMTLTLLPPSPPLPSRPLFLR